MAKRYQSGNQTLITTLVSFLHCIVCPVLRRLITTLVSFGHCIVYPVLRR
jgi:hypothetical protein